MKRSEAASTNVSSAARSAGKETTPLSSAIGWGEAGDEVDALHGLIAPADLSWHAAGCALDVHADDAVVAAVAGAGGGVAVLMPSTEPPTQEVLGFVRALTHVTAPVSLTMIERTAAGGWQQAPFTEHWQQALAQLPGVQATTPVQGLTPNRGSRLGWAGTHLMSNTPSNHAPAPVLAVVGCVNMGKSSIVSTLVEDDAVLIESRPGSTVYNHSYDLTIDDQTAFTLVDTPGFQNARRALAWMEQWQADHAADNVNATQAVRAFVDANADDESFQHEVRLLTPILDDGAGVLYVVNGTQPFLARYEAEMRILAKTGAPRMGVINMHGDQSLHADAWEAALKPYFKVTRFDALGASAIERQQLFASFRGVDDRWAPVVDQALDKMQLERDQRHTMAAGAIATTVLDILTSAEEENLRSTQASARDEQTRTMAKRLFANIRAREQSGRVHVAELYRHYHLKTSEAALELLDNDLLDRDQWQLLGLTNTQLATAGVTAGAVTGGVIDASVGGLSFFTGTAVGAVLGGIGAVMGGHRLAKVRILGKKLGGKVVRVEAPDATQFAFVLLDRALLHWHQVAGRAHARRDELVVADSDSNSGIVSQLRQQSAPSFGQIADSGQTITRSARRRIQAATG